METKIFKGRNLKKIAGKVWNWMVEAGEALLLFIIQLVFAIGAAIIALIADVCMFVWALISPVWVPIMLLWQGGRKTLAKWLYDEKQTEPEGKSNNTLVCELIWYSMIGECANSLFNEILERIYHPLLMWIPMKARQIFIYKGTSVHKLATLSTRVQLGFYRVADENEKKFFILNCSKEPFYILWKEDAFRCFCARNASLPPELMESLYEDRNKSKVYLEIIKCNISKYQPTKELTIWLVKQNHDDSRELVLFILKQYNIDCIEILRAVHETKNEQFINAVGKIVAMWADIKVVTETATAYEEATHSHRENVMGKENASKRWTDLCCGQKEIAVAAQKLMKEWQYTTFVRTHHQLADEALESILEQICKSVVDMTYLRAILGVELDRISSSTKLMSIIRLNKRSNEFYLSYKRDAKAKAKSEAAA